MPFGTQVRLDSNKVGFWAKRRGRKEMKFEILILPWDLCKLETYGECTCVKVRLGKPSPMANGKVPH